MVDALAVYKDANGDLEAEHLSNLTEDEAIEIGLARSAPSSASASPAKKVPKRAQSPAPRAAEEGDRFLPTPARWDVLEDIPNDTAAALILLEHRWAIPAA